MKGVLNGAYDQLEAALKAMPGQIGTTPKAVLVISGHWEERDFTVMSSPRPPMIYDYSCFPAHTYRITYAAPGSPQTAERVRTLIEAAGLAARLDPLRGFDHGSFAPLAVIYPDADVPVLELSMRHGYDPKFQIAIGLALAPLRDEGVLILGSGLSYHHLREFGPTATAPSAEFDLWLQQTLVEATYKFMPSASCAASSIFTLPRTMTSRAVSPRIQQSSMSAQACMSARLGPVSRAWLYAAAT